MSSVTMNHVVAGEYIALLDGNIVTDFDLFSSMSPSITTQTDANYYKLGMVPPGVGSADAVNVAQLNAVSSSLSSNDASQQTTINTQGAAISSMQTLMTAMQNSMSTVWYAGDYKTSAQASDHGKWLKCDGRTVSRSTYATLFAVVGTAFGAGDGSTTFTLPNASGRTSLFAGQGATAEGGGTGTTRSLGNVGGAETHTLTIAEMPNHSHTYTNQTIAFDATISLLGSGNRVTASPTANTSAVGGGGAHTIMDPYLVAGSLFIYTG